MMTQNDGGGTLLGGLVYAIFQAIFRIFYFFGYLIFRSPLDEII
jgi:hypothetical protein